MRCFLICNIFFFFSSFLLNMAKTTTSPTKFKKTYKNEREVRDFGSKFYPLMMVCMGDDDGWWESESYKPPLSYPLPKRWWEFVYIPFHHAHVKWLREFVWGNQRRERNEKEKKINGNIIAFDSSSCHLHHHRVRLRDPSYLPFSPIRPSPLRRSRHPS